MWGFVIINTLALSQLTSPESRTAGLTSLGVHLGMAALQISGAGVVWIID